MLCIGVWYDYKLGKVYISLDVNKNSPFKYSCSLENHNDNTMFLKSARQYAHWRNLINQFQYGNVRFENMKIKNEVMQLFKSLLS